MSGECYEIDSLGKEFSIPSCGQDSVVLCLVQYSGRRLLLLSDSITLTQSRPQLIGSMFENEKVEIVNVPESAKISWLEGQKVLSCEREFVP